MEQQRRLLFLLLFCKMQNRKDFDKEAFFVRQGMRISATMHCHVFIYLFLRITQRREDIIIASNNNAKS